MSSKNNKRSFLSNLLWYASGSNIRELAGVSQNKSNYFGIGGVNIFATFIILLVGILSFNIAFPKVSFPICLLVGLIISVLVFTFNRQTLNALSYSDNTVNNQRHSLTLFPIFLFSIFIGIVMSTSIKFYLFEIPLMDNIMLRLAELDKFSDATISSKISSWSISLVLILVILLPTLIKFYSLPGNFQKNRSSLMNELMWFCSGANKNILRKCPNEYSKYFGIGGTILFTSLMATLSGGYAFFTAFDSASLAICFGLFWGAMIFNLDRFIVNTMYSDGKHTISWSEIWGGLPRIIIAIFLGIVISYPLELKLFEDEINASIEIMKVKNLKDFNGETNSTFSGISSNNNDIRGLGQKKDDLQNEIDAARVDWQSVKQILRHRYDVDANGNRIRIDYYSWPPAYYTKKQFYEEIKNRNQVDIGDIRGKIKEKEDKIKVDEKVKSGYEQSYKKATIALSDLSTRMQAFSQLKDKKPTIKIASLFIMLLLIIIEISPVLFKMMIASGDYDIVLNAEKNEMQVNEIVRISQKNDWANTEIIKMIAENKQKISDKQNELTAELNANQELLNAIAKAQTEIAQIAIAKWKEREMEKAIENPESFIQTNITNS